MKLTPLLIAVCFRVAVALLSVTFFQPDEYFQALEPAHQIVFGYGHLTWEWRSNPPIRSIFFPMLFTPLYWLLKVTGMDDGILLILAPKLLQGLFASITDVSICRLVRNVLGERYVSTAFFLSLTSIFHLQALSRTLSNSMETSLTTWALANWPISSGALKRNKLVASFLIAAAACMIRPTNAIIWVFLLLELSWRLRHDVKRIFEIWGQAATIGVAACTFLFYLDSWYFGTSTFTPLNFIRTNLSSVSTFYGQSPWHYYISQGIPILCNVTTVFVLQGLWKGIFSRSPPLRRMVALIFWTIGIYSLMPHKEWRFIHPLLPVMHVLASKVIVEDYTGKPNHSLWLPPRLRRRWRFPILLALSVAPYLLFFQSRAQIAVMDHLRSIPVAELRSVGFLMPCHSTPWQSYLHRPHLTKNTLWAIGCEPPLEGQALDTYRDQSDIFYASPIEYLRTRFPASVNRSFPPSPHPTSIPGARESKNDVWIHSWPSHLVFFGYLLINDDVQVFLDALGYQEEWHSMNGWEQDERRRGGVAVWSWHDSTNVRTRLESLSN